MNFPLLRNHSLFPTDKIRSGQANFLALCLIANLLPIAASAQVVQQSAQKATGSLDGGGAEKNLRSLEQGPAVKGELSGGQEHRYRVRLGADQYLKAVIEQQGIDVIVQIIGVEGKPILDFDVERRLQGEEQVALVAEAAGEYQLVVQHKQKWAAAGSYEIRIEELRAATNNDRALQEAYKLYAESSRLFGAGKYNESLTIAQRSLEIRERILGADHPDVATDLNRIAILYAIKREYEKAESLYQRALLIREKVLGPDHPEVASTLNNIAILHKNRREFAKAEQLHERALSIREKTFGPDHPEVAVSLINFATLYLEKREYTKAEPLFLRAININQRIFGPDHSSVAIPLNNLANVYRYKGDYAKAEPLYQRALQIREKVLGPDHLEVAHTLNNLGIIHLDREDYEKAEQYYLRALRIKEKALGPDNPEVATTLCNLALLYDEKHEYAKAESLFQRALSVQEKRLGLNHPDYARSLINFAGLYQKQGEYAKAEPLYQRALSIQENELGPNNPDLRVPLYNLAKLYAARGDIERAITFQQRGNALLEQSLYLNLVLGSERHKLAYLAHYAKHTDFTFWLHSQAAPGDAQALNLAFTALLRRKGRGLDAMANTIANLRRHATAQDLELFDQLAEARSQLAAIFFRESGPAEPGTQRTRTRLIEERIEDLEARLSARSADFRAQTQPVTLSAVQSVLPANSALIEFVIYEAQDPRTVKTQPPRYLAYLLSAQGQPKWVDLGEAAPIERAVEAWRQSLRENSVDVKQLGRAVDQLVMRPVRSLLQAEADRIRHLLIAPDGSLNLIPFAALVDEENRYLIERYTISFLTSGRDLLRLQNTQPSQSSTLVLANPFFGKMASARVSRDSTGPASDNEVGKQGERRGDSARIFFPSLPGTESEALAIKALLPEASLLQREEASETALKQVSGPRILHIATHGFFIDDSKPAHSASPGPSRSAFAVANPYTVQLEATPDLVTARESVQRLRERGVDAYMIKSKVKGKGAYFRVRSGNFPTQAGAQKYGADLREKGVAGEFFVARYKPPPGDLIAPVAAGAEVSKEGVADSRQPINETISDLALSNFVAQVKDPLLRSGLALAGANEGKSGDDDGLLTALEVAGLNLSGTKLAVLSACDTGLGEIRKGEGVQGLRRALVLAGSESQVISLWSIPDELAKEVIIPYYKALRRGEGRAEGLREVQLRMLRSKGRRHPFYWAAFIQSGEWANLDGRR